ncbi:type I-B CRISPR-associated protein Cas8b1/Cst1 [Rummeliibacillus suwonensis]|uniref:type I-B CRISPR-associated protein Cas8b1/Cst1 n=1 Tax=Rummeliibacillus suwonensis TaxID=1306154 RepID=UPI001FD31185|nr:type I-B CRISPR-associated protein Cas8b1/Cst1 [Rummeliibacillus suwonensis]
MIKVTLNDFLYNSGILGLIRILDHSGINYQKEGNQSILFEESALENFENHYFNYLIDKYDYDTSYSKMLNYESFLLNYKQHLSDDKQLEHFNEIIDNMKRWLTSNSYTNTYRFLTEIDYFFEVTAKSLKKISKKKNETFEDIADQVKETSEKLLTCIENLKHPQARHYLVARTLSYQIVQGFWTNVAFLNSTASKKDLYIEYKNYFTDAVQNYLETKKNEKKYAKNKFQCATCDNTMGKLNEAFDLTWLQKTGVDAARKSSHYWDHQRDIFICPVCNLIYSCVPLGFTLVKGKGIFINNNQSIEQLISANLIPLRDGENELTMNELEEKAYYRILDVMDQNVESKKQLEIDNIQIVKFDKNNESRPYTFNILSKQKAALIVKAKKDLNYLVGKYLKEGREYTDLYQEVIKRIYNGQSFYDLLNKLMKLYISGDFKNLAAIYRILNITNIQFEGSVHFMRQVELQEIRNFGEKLREIYVNENQKNKINGILYRLLNALKVKNSNKFLETLIQAYSYKKIEIPKVFVKALSDEKVFQTIGYAFLLGFSSNKQSINKGEEK